MASLCKKQQCTIDRRGFRQELDSWKHKLLHCVGFESILEGLVGPELVEDLKVFQDFGPVSVSDWSFKENCLFCWLRRDKVKEHLIGLSKKGLDDLSKPLLVKDQLTVIRLEKQAEEFLHAVLSSKDAPNFSDPHVPIVAREILQKMISQLAAEYTSKPSSPQDSRSDSPPHSDQSLPAPLLLSGAPPTTTAATVAGPAHNQNPVLSKLLMADQDAPLDLTIKKPLAEPTEQDGVLDLSIKKNRHSNSSLPGLSPCFSPSALKRRSLSEDGQVGLFKRSLRDGRKRENFGHSASNNPTSPLAYSLHIKEEGNLELAPESPLSDNPSSGTSYLIDSESDPGNKQPRKKRGRYRQYNTELLEEAILVVMGGKMSVSKAQSIYGIPHSTLEYKVKERLGTLKHPPKKKARLMSQVDDQGVSQSPEGQELPTSQNVDAEDTEKASEDGVAVLHDGGLLSNE
uniref:Ligand dependent nuclear receptor corepressor n=1 Tax=Iconisemion striatum TaxID=60296 RepID=A0A1A7YDV9_9TELE